MNVRPRPVDLAPDAYPERDKSLLRFVACGSVDHGKSTLLGRLIYESKQLMTDQLDALVADSRRFGTQGAELDFSLLLDGLAAEREQNITIDVAYRFFTTARRKFIVIDAPGHEQYTANMATGASVADLALVLVSADEGLTPQTKRHLLILSMLDVSEIVLVANKMDCVGWSADRFRALERQFREFTGDGIGKNVVCIPVAAKSGDNVVSRSPNMPWYRGPTLIEHLEQVEPVKVSEQAPLRMPIQLVSRPDPSFRGYSGMVTSGAVHIGMEVIILPSGRRSRVERIVTFDGDLPHAEAGRSVTLTLADQIDASRGDVVAAGDRTPAVTDQINARIFWMNERPLEAGQSYLFKLATRTVRASIEAPIDVIDLDTGQTFGAASVKQNEIGLCTLKFDRPTPVDRYAEHKDTGSFILIDPKTYETVGMGCIESTPTSPAKRWIDGWSAKPKPPDNKLKRWTESRARSLAKAVSWRATGSIDTFVVSFVITRSPKIAASVALTEIVTKILIYYFHERLWALVPWGKR